MGSQRLAVDDRGRPVLVKAAPAGLGAERLRREAANLRAAAHPGVVEVLGLEEDDAGEVHLRLLVAGTRTLADLGDDLPAGLRALAAVAATLSDLHDVGLVHGRVLAEHVVLDGAGRPVLCGFADAGSSRELDPAADVAGLGELLAGLVRRAPGGDGDWEPIPERRSGRGGRWDGFTRRALLTLADQATADDARRRPTARAFAAALLAAMPQPAPATRRWWQRAASDQAAAGERVDRPLAGWRDHAARPPLRSAPAAASEAEVAAVGAPNVVDGAAEVPPGEERAPSASAADDLAARRLEVARRRHPSWSPGAAGRGAPTARPDPVAMAPAAPPDAGLAARADVASARSRRPPVGRRGRAAPARPAPPALGAVAMLQHEVAGGDARRPRFELGRVATGLAGAVGLGLLVFGIGALLRPADPPELATAAPPDEVVCSDDAAACERAADAAPSGCTDADGPRCAGTTAGCGTPAAPGDGRGGAAPATADEGEVPCDVGSAAGCPAAAEPAADPDGDGCPSTAVLGDAVVEVDGVRYGVGRPGDLLLLGDWDCDGAATVAVVRPGSGEVFVFDGWAGAGAARTAPSAGTVPGARAVERGEGADGCDALVVVDDGGRRTEVPA